MPSQRTTNSSSIWTGWTFKRFFTNVYEKVSFEIRYSL